ncbi:MAG: flagellar basal body protein FliL [Desulfobacterales bacterium]|nr:flagellar basal body protein FliL [Desulfobacterales bacterium]
MSKKVIIIISLAIFIFMGAIGGGFFLIWSKMSQMNTAQTEDPAAEEGEEGEEANESIGPMYALDSFVVNLAEAGNNRYLRVTMELELDDEALKTELEQRLPQVRNAMLMTLPTKKTAEINTVDGKLTMRDQLIDEINGFLTTGEVTNIYFTEFVIQ